jgi:hypothetical protein
MDSSEEDLLLLIDEEEAPEDVSSPQDLGVQSQPLVVPMAAFARRR